MIGLAIAVAVGGGMMGIASGIEERRRHAPSLAAAKLGAHPADVTVLLPVRDEAINLRPCTAALLALAGRPRVRVIDDGSADGTAAQAAAMAAAEPRLEVLPAGPLPDGWRGKVHALQEGARGLRTTWLLLVDADARLHPRALERALAAAALWRLDAVSLAGHQEARGLTEGLLVPAVFALLDSQLGDWAEAAAGGGPPVANGQFLLLRREAWERSGGFAAIRRETLDDVAAVAALRQHGYRTGFFRAPELLSVRMYRGARDVIDGWRRNLGGLFGPRPGTALATLAVLTLPAVALIAACAAGREVDAGVIWLGGVAASALLRAGSGHRPILALLHPLDALFVAWVLGAGVSDWRRGRLRSWKGREIRV
jgi:cellulose synthase/poly-beta-1,6-N-acetylglucosamine synthase-like glycosyltransferase